MAPQESERALNVTLPLRCSIRLLWAWQGLEELDAVVTAETRDTISRREVTNRGEALNEIGPRRCGPIGIPWTTETPMGNPAEVIVQSSSAPEVLYVAEAVVGMSPSRCSTSFRYFCAAGSGSVAREASASAGGTCRAEGRTGAVLSGWEYMFGRSQGQRGSGRLWDQGQWHR